MNFQFLSQNFENFSEGFFSNLEVFGPKVVGAILVILIGLIISYGAYRFILFIFKKFKILKLIDKIWEWFEKNTTKIVDQNLEDNKSKVAKKKTKNHIGYDRITAKALGYYIFLLFFRWAVVILGITEIEQFMQDLINYLPSLFIGILIGYFWLRFANSVHDIIYQALELTKDKTSKIIATWAKLIIMFFTLMIMLNYIKIVDDFIINALFIGFITTMTISFGIAFGLGGKDIAREILEWFRK